MSSSKMQSALLGALVYVVLGTIAQFIVVNSGMIGSPVGGLLLCLVAIIAPVVAVWHYTSTNSLTIPAGEGAGLGALASVAGAVISGVISLLLQAVGLFPSTEEMLEMQREQMVSQGMSAEQVEQAMEMASNFSNPLIGFVIGIVVGAVLGAIAGAISALIFKKGEEDELVV